MRKKISLYGVCCMFGTMSVGIDAQDETHYISSLDEEASRQELHHEMESERNLADIKLHDEDKVSSEKLHDASHNTLVGGMTLPQFQYALQENFMGSYSYFKRLSKQGKQAVYKTYQDSPELHEIRESIIQAYNNN